MPSATKHLYAVVTPGHEPREALRHAILERAAKEPVPDDLCCATGFGDGAPIRGLVLPAGRGSLLQRDLERAVSALSTAVREAFRSETYRSRRRGLATLARVRLDQAISHLRERARARDVAVVRTETSISVLPIHDGSIILGERLATLPPEEKARLQTQMALVGKELHQLFCDARIWAAEAEASTSVLDEEVAASAIATVFADLLRSFAGLPAVIDHLSALQADIAGHFGQLFDLDGTGAARESLRRYRVDLLVDRSRQLGAPVVSAEGPTYASLFGRTERDGDGVHVRPGALLRARGGYLLLDAHELLDNRAALRALATSMETDELRVSPLGHALLGVVSEASAVGTLVVPLDATVVLMGDRRVYDALTATRPALAARLQLESDAHRGRTY